MNEWSAGRLALMVIVGAVVLMVALALCYLLFGSNRTLYSTQQAAPRAPLEQAMAHMQTGDLLLFSADDLPLMKLLFSSQFTHVALVLRDPTSGALYTLESIPKKADSQTRGLVDLVTGDARKDGPQVLPLRERVQSYQGAVWWRPLLSNPHGRDRNAMLYARLWPVLQDYCRRYQFDYGFPSMLWPQLIRHHHRVLRKELKADEKETSDEKSVLVAPRWFADGDCSQCRRHFSGSFFSERCKRAACRRRGTGVFCSELVAEALFACGVFHRDPSEPDRADNFAATFAPARFALDRLPCDERHWRYMDTAQMPLLLI